MKYYIETTFFAAPTCDLSKEQYEQFRKSCQEECEANVKACEGIPDCEQHILTVAFRENWEKTTDDQKVENDELPFASVTLVRIFPASILKEAPHRFNDKKAFYREWEIRYEKDKAALMKTDPVLGPCYQRDMERIKRYQRLAEEVLDNSKQGTKSKTATKQANAPKKKRGPKANTFHDQLEKRVNEYPALMDCTAKHLAQLIGCKETTVKTSPIWHRIMDVRRRPKTISWEDAGQIPDRRSEEDENDQN